MLIIICRCWPLMHPFYLFISEARPCPFGGPVIFETKRGKSLLFEACWMVCETSRSMDICTIFSLQPHTHTHTALQWDRTHRHQFPSFLPVFLLLSLLSLSFQVVLEYLRCVIRHWFPSEREGKKEILDRKVYKKRTLNFWHSSHSCFKMSRMERQAKASPSHFFFFVYLLPFLPFLFQGNGG